MDATCAQPVDVLVIISHIHSLSSERHSASKHVTVLELHCVESLNLCILQFRQHSSLLTLNLAVTAATGGKNLRFSLKPNIAQKQVRAVMENRRRLNLGRRTAHNRGALLFYTDTGINALRMCNFKKSRTWCASKFYTSHLVPFVALRKPHAQVLQPFRTAILLLITSSFHSSSFEKLEYY